MSALDLDAIEARATAATPGPWRAAVSEWANPDTVIAPTDHEVIAHQFITDDAEFVARAREDVPALVAEVRRLREDAERWVEALSRTENRLTLFEGDAERLAAALRALADAMDMYDDQGSFSLAASLNARNAIRLHDEVTR